MLTEVKLEKSLETQIKHTKLNVKILENVKTENKNSLTLNY